MENYVPVEKTDRIARLKAAYSELKTYKYGAASEIPDYRECNTGDRLLTLGFLDGWRKYNDVYPLRWKRSLAEASELDSFEPVIYDGELLAGQLWLPDHTPGEQERYDTLAREYSDMTLDISRQGARRDHITIDFDKLINVGVEAVIERAKTKRAQIRLADFDAGDMTVPEQKEFYDCLIVELEALLRLEDRYAKKAREAAEAEQDRTRKKELTRIAEALDRVPRKPAGSFFEAVQSVHFFLSNLFGLYPLGRPDRYLYPLYEADLRAGRITREEAQELIDCLCLGVTCRVFSRAACGFIVGGSKEDGSSFENDLTYMFITALDHIASSDPNGALSVCPTTSERLLSYAVEVIAKGCTHPAFYNDAVITDSLVRHGCKREEAIQYIHSTCAEITVAGKSKGHTTTTAINIPKLLLDTVNEKTDFTDLEALTDAFIDRVADRLYKDMDKYVMSILEAARNGNDAMRVCGFIDDCVERGKGLYDGGAKYCVLLPIFVGFANAVDSLQAIRKLVFEEKRLTLAAFNEIVRNDFEGNEPLRQYILHRIGHYGNDEAEVDALAAQLAAKLKSIVTDREIPGKKHLFAGTFSYVNHAVFGAETGATFDGRYAHKSLSDGCCPAQGMDTCGPTALINSLTGWDQSDFLAGMVVNLKFTRSVMNAGKKEVIARLIQTFMEKGGLELQINSVDRETLEDAKVHPEAHRDLLVRIGGYSDYFVRLDPTLQQEIIDRTQY